MGMNKLSIVILVGLFGMSCLGMPKTVKPVGNFDVNRYMGVWYEVARLDHSFERGLSKVTAKYSLRDDGGVNVINRGFSEKDDRWKETQGRAYFVDSDKTGYLKVSFFGPFYGSYVVFELDEKDYSYAFVSGPDTTYLWLLARSPKVKPEVIERFKKRSAELGFDMDQLIFVEH